MARIGRKHKKKMQGTSSYVVNPDLLSQPSHKRTRLKYKSRGISYATPAEHDTASKQEYAAPTYSNTPVERISERYSIYYIWVYRLDAPPEEHWKGSDGTIQII